MHFESNMYNTAHHLIGNTHHQCVCCMHVSFKSILITNVEETEHTVSEENQSRSAWWLKPQQHEEWLLIVRVNFATDKTMGWNPDAEKWWKQPHLQPTFLFKVDGQKLKGGDGIKDSCCYCCCSLHLPPLPIIKLDCHWSDPPTLYVAKTQLSVSWMPDRWSAHRHVLLHHQRTDKHWTPVGFFLVFFPPSQASFTPQHANSISPPPTTSSPVFRVKQVINNTPAAPPSPQPVEGATIYTNYIMDGGGSAQGRARSLQTNTVTTSLQLSPAPTCSSPS